MEEKEESIISITDLPFQRKEKSKSVHELALERRKEIIEKYIKQVGFFNARLMYKKLAMDYHVAERTIHKDFRWIKGNIIPEDLQEIKIELKLGRGFALKAAIDAVLEARAMINSKENPNPEAIELKARTSINLMNVERSLREELEGWGEKVKVPDPTSLSLQAHELGLYGPLIEEGAAAVAESNARKESEKVSKTSV